jgi:hypothetical protein
MARKKVRWKKGPACSHMGDIHGLRLSTSEIMAVVSAATHGVRRGYDDGDDSLIDAAINRMLDQSNIDCKFRKDGTMTLTYNPVGNEEDSDG